MDDTNKDGDQVLWGAVAIAAEINRNRRQTYHLLQNGLLPADKIGDIWVTTRRRLRARLKGNGEAA